jgi:hypothetical protein
MGQVLSTIAQDITSVVDAIGKTVTDVGGAVGQLTGITQGLTAAAAPATTLTAGASGYRRSSTIMFADPQDFNTALKATITAAKNAASGTFTKKWPTDTANGVDAGVVAGYNQGGDLTNVVNQITNDFTNWALPLSAPQIQQMAKTLAIQVQAQTGLAGVSDGTFYLNPNQSLLWVVSYGMFTVNQTQQGLVYAFTAGFDSGWGA